MQVFGIGRRRSHRSRGGYGYRLGTGSIGAGALVSWFAAAIIAGGVVGLATMARTSAGRATITSKVGLFEIIPASQAKAASNRRPIRDYIANSPASREPATEDGKVVMSIASLKRRRAGAASQATGFRTDAQATRSGATYYPSCAHAWAAGAAPIMEGEPGYRPQLDGDNDGIACEPFRRRY